MKWVIRNMKTGSLMKASNSLIEAQEWAETLNLDYQTDAYKVQSVDLYFTAI